MNRGGRVGREQEEPEHHVEQSPTTHWDIWQVTLDGEPRTAPLVAKPGAQGHPVLSPDGRWLAYSDSLEAAPGSPDLASVMKAEVWIQPYPGPGSPVKASTDVGYSPTWSRDGSELYYRRGSEFLAVTIDTQPALEAGTPRVLFEQESFFDPVIRVYDFAPSTQKFAFIQPGGNEGPRELRLVHNWFDELKRLAPAGQ